MQVTAAPLSGGPASIGALISAKALGSGRVNQDGTFELRGIAGPQMIRVQAMPTGWALKSITLDGADITDTGYDFRPGNNVTGMVITLTDRLTEFTGNVRDARGQPVADYVLVVIPRRCEAVGRAIALRADDPAKSERYVQHQGAAARTLSVCGRYLRSKTDYRTTLPCSNSFARARAASRSPKVKC